MKKATYILLISAVLFYSTVMVSCRKYCNDYKNPECENYDPCRANPLSNADFDIVLDYINPKTNSHTYYRVPEDDTIRTGTYNFKCWQSGNDSVLWKIGTEKRYRRGDSVIVFFDKDVPGTEGPITIRCITCRKPNPRCKAGDDGRDTVVKHYIMRAYRKGNYDSYNGVFRGCLTAKPQDTFNVTFINSKPDGIFGAYYNLPNGYHSKDIAPWDLTLDKLTNRFATSVDGPVFLLNKTLDSIHVEIPSLNHWGYYPGPNPDPIYKNPTTFNGYRIKQ
jgi:hypothetical protein